MFRTSNKRGQKRFDFFRHSNHKKNGKILLTAEGIKLIENTSLLSLGEKIELLSVATGNKLTTELFSQIGDDLDKVSQVENFLQKLPFIYFKDKMVRFNKNTNHTENFNWFQVSVNESVSEFMKQYPDDLTEFEEGVLYGFPLSAIRAFARLIEARHDAPNPATYYLAGWCSKDFWDDEQEYYQLWWERLKKVSPKLIDEAERMYDHMEYPKRSHKRPTFGPDLGQKVGIYKKHVNRVTENFTSTDL